MNNRLEEIYLKSVNLQLISEDEYLFLTSVDIDELTDYAARIKRRFKGERPQTCALINARSGYCSEDCTFCAQSARYSTDAPKYGFISLDKVDEAAKDAASKGIDRFCVVTSGFEPDNEEFALIKRSVEIIASYGLRADASVGCLTYERLVELRDAGLGAYHHNLEVAGSLFPSICSTHDYDRDVQAVRDAIRAGLYVCCGGIYGIGETWEHRYELAATLRELNVPSVPVNFLSPISGTPLESEKLLPPEEARRILAVLRFVLPDKSIRVCGGRNLIFDTKSAGKVLDAGASGIMVGDYLTEKGVDFEEDLQYIRQFK